MTHLKKAAAFLSVILLLTISLSAQTQNGNGAVKGLKAQSATLNGTQTGLNWIDENGDGICDNYGTENQGTGQRLGRRGKAVNGTTGQVGGYGDGTGVRPQDGTGFGRKAGNGTGTGTCDGTGPKGASRRGNK